MSTAQALETELQRFHGPDADEPPAGPHEPVGERIGRTLTALPGIGGPLRHPDGLVLENGEQPDGPFVHGIRPAMHRWEIPRRERFAWRARIHANPASSLAYRICVAVAGALLIVLSALTGWLPGPGGIPLLLIGMAVLASEFRWAHRITVGVTMLVRRVGCWPRRARAGAVVACGSLVVACGYVALLVTGIPAWLPGWAAGALSHVPGLG